MKVRNRMRRSVFFCIGAALSLVVFGAAAQTPAAGEQVQGTQLQAWIDARFSYAGLHHPSGCHLLNTGGILRTLFLSCPNGWSDKIAGTARVDGDRLCTKFPIPNTSGEEECLAWYRVGDARYEQRRDGTTVNTTLYVLPARPEGAR